MEFQPFRFAAREPAGFAPRPFESGAQLFPAQWFQKVVVTARFKDRLTIDIIAPTRCDNDAREIQFFANRARDLKAAYFRKQQVANDRVGSLGKGKLDPGLAF